MKITNEKLKQIIKEELETVLNERRYDLKTQYEYYYFLRIYAEIGSGKFDKLLERIVFAEKQFYNILKQGGKESDQYRNMRIAQLQFTHFLNKVSPISILVKIDTLPSDMRDPDNLEEIHDASLRVKNIMQQVSDDPKDIFKEISVYLEDMFSTYGGMKPDSEEVTKSADRMRNFIGTKLGFDEQEIHDYGGSGKRSFLQKAGSFITGKGFKQ